MQYNGDTGANYTYHILDGDGASVVAGAATGLTSLIFGDGTSSTAQANTFGVAIVDILDYTNTNKYKTHKSLGGYDLNGSGEVPFWSGLWLNTAAITSISIITNTATTFATGAHFALYGIKG